MNSEHTEEQIAMEQASPSDHLANERTFLAWIRTSIALMGFGFVVVKFALFIRQISFVLTDNSNSTGLPGKGYSSIIGVLLVAIGAVTALLAYLRYRHVEKQLKNKMFFPSYSLTLVLTLFVIIISILLIVYLVPGIM